MSNYNEVAQQFVQYYYQAFDADRNGVKPLYRDNSCLTFETNQSMGVNSIIEKLTSLPFGKLQHNVATMDAQPLPNDAILVLVTGALLIDDSQHPQSFAQTFHLVPAAGSYYVLNDIFKLVYPA